MRYAAIVIGTGFGGAILAGRLARKYPGAVLVLERGKRYPMGSFPRSPVDMASNFWNQPNEKTARPKSIGEARQQGLFDIRNFRHLDVVTAAGLGGGSLIYANVFMEPPKEVFEHWPSSCSLDALKPYYEVTKSVLGARPVPKSNEPGRQLVRTALFEDVARELGRESKLTDINVFFGNDFDNPTPIGLQETNRYGAVQTSCVYCGECDAGCNTHSKNTLDLNYLFVAEHRYDADVRTEHIADRIVPLDENEKDDPSADGSNGYRVYFRNLAEDDGAEISEVTDRVVVAAGAVGSTELLLRCRDREQTLPRLSPALGYRFSANGDFLSFVVDGKRETRSNYGPVITQRIDINLFKDFDRTRAFIVEDAAYPGFIAWTVQGSLPGFLMLKPLWRAIRDIWHRITKGTSTGHMGYVFGDIMQDDLSNKSCILLCMGLDQGDGCITLNRDGNANIDWPYRNSMRLYKGILSIGKRFKRIVGARFFIPLPTWNWPFRKNVCVHALGGCALGDDAQNAVTSADPGNFGEAFNYKNLFVADGAILPGPVGANPSATIAALAERVAEGITGDAPDDAL